MFYRKRFRFVRGEGVYVWDKKGRCYLDFIVGIGVNVFGYVYLEWVFDMSC